MHGFGVPERNVWIGNDAIHQLTKGKNSSLYISITLVNGTTLYQLYNQFSISDEADKYQLFLAGPTTGTLGDSMYKTRRSSADLSGMAFSTPDRKNDKCVYDCASYWKLGWWMNCCFDACLNGLWSVTGWSDPWYPLWYQQNSKRPESDPELELEDELEELEP
ncbi:fibroleukin-like [Saccostrea cucullata]|uniref:fibroleukin-like n=1 Tax=Saccostrea cuccullata TaxID=36930 RepID=UPI002ED1A0EA